MNKTINVELGVAHTNQDNLSPQSGLLWVIISALTARCASAQAMQNSARRATASTSGSTSASDLKKGLAKRLGVD